MNDDLAPELSNWRREVVEFLDAHSPATPFDHEFTTSVEEWNIALEFSKHVAERNWVALTWPTADGGLGRSRLEHLVMMEEFFYREAPLVNFIGWGLAAGTLLRGGTPEQKLRYLPSIARSEVQWAEGLTEPDAGSDLASLRTRADRNDDGWVLNGQKTYMTWGHLADLAYVAARTSEGQRHHEGISIFAVDLRAEGVTVAPMMNLGGGRQNVIYFDDVQLTPDALLGVEDAGWSYIMGAFYASGGTYSTHSRFQRLYDDVKAYCCESKTIGGSLLIDQSSVRTQLLELATIAETQRLLAYESARRLDEGLDQRFAGAIVAVSGKEAMPRAAELCMDIVGPMAQLREEDRWAPIHGLLESTFRRSFANHAGGTPQVKRMVLATKGLGLPR